MENGAFYRLAADAILLVHALFVAFVVLGLVLILLGKGWRWRWVRNPWFRLAHLAAIAFVVVESWLGAVCPLTVWELALREKAGDSVYAGAFIAHWLEAVLYYRAPPWVFITVYTAFGGLVIASWFWVPPRRLRRPR
ncbi:MAG: DUF2784 domain-containing protein [Pseudomonadota bacterium]